MQSPAGRVVGARSVLFERSELRTTVEMTLPARPYALGQPTNDAPGGTTGGQDLVNPVPPMGRSQNVSTNDAPARGKLSKKNITSPEAGGRPQPRTSKRGYVWIGMTQIPCILVEKSHKTE